MDVKILENLIVKGMITDKTYLAIVSSVFQKEYFDSDVIGKIFLYMKEHVEKFGNIAPREIIIGHVGPEARDVFEEIDDLNFDVARDYDCLFEETNIYLKDKAIKDAVLRSVEKINAGPDHIKDIYQIIEAALIKDLQIDLGANYFHDFKERLKGILTHSIKRIPTYFPQFDEYISGGFPPYTLSVIVSKIHGWKSAFLANIGARQTLAGHNVGLVTLEMSEVAFSQRFDAIFGLLDINKMYVDRTLTSRLIATIDQIKKESKHGQLWIKEFPTGTATILDFKRWIRELKMRGVELDILYVDYINLMKPSYKEKTDLYSDVKGIAEELRALSLQFNIPVVSVSQLNREGGVLAFTDVDFNFIAESLGVPATADFMSIFGANDESMVYESELAYKIVKNRLGGRVGSIDKMFFDSRSLKLYDSTELNMWIDDAEKTGDEHELAPIRTTRGRRE